MSKDETFHKAIVARWNGPSGIVKNPFVDLSDYDDIPLFFFAGPIQGASDWHYELFRLLQMRVRRFIAVLPTRYQESHPLYSYRLTGEPEHFTRQRRFESYYIRLAREAMLARRGGGALLFNLCCQKVPRSDGRQYAIDTWREASETYARLEYQETLSVLVRGEPGFLGLEMLKDCFDEAVMGNFPFFRTLEELADEAAQLVPPDCRI